MWDKGNGGRGQETSVARPGPTTHALVKDVDHERVLVAHRDNAGVLQLALRAVTLEDDVAQQGWKRDAST